MRLFRFVAVSSFFTYLAWQICGSWGADLDPLSFIVGLAVAALSGGILSLIEGWWSTLTRPYHPQVVQLETKETPGQITSAAFRALLKGVLLVIILILLAFYGYTYLVP